VTVCLKRARWRRLNDGDGGSTQGKAFIGKGNGSYDSQGACLQCRRLRRVFDDPGGDGAATAELRADADRAVEHHG
jgi:hypothetical protein